METCDTCKWWKRSAYDESCGSCSLLGFDKNEIYGSDIEVYSDSAPITTGEKFGCIHHEPK